MRLRSNTVAAAGLLFCVSIHVGAQCLQNHYVSDGAPSSQRDCQPTATIFPLAPEQMSPAAQDLATARHADLVRAASFYGYDLAASGWTYQQFVSPVVQKHLLLSFTHAAPGREASHFVAIVPADTGERVQVVPTFAHGLRLFDPGWQKRGTYSVFNRLLKSEQGGLPITGSSQWINYGALYLALIGLAPAVPTETDSVKATWDLTAKRATTPVIIVSKNGEAVIAFSDVSDPAQSVSWKLFFDKNGRIQKAERQSFAPEKVRTMETAQQRDGTPLPPPSPLNPK